MSSTLTLPVPPTRRPSLASQADSLAEARELLRRAARLPYHATRADAWARRFRRLTSDATAAIGQHVLRLQRSEATGIADPFNAKRALKEGCSPYYFHLFGKPDPAEEAQAGQVARLQELERHRRASKRAFDKGAA